MFRHTYLLVVMLCLISACGSDRARQEEMTHRPLRELFPPNATAQSADEPAAAPAAQTSPPPAAAPAALTSPPPAAAPRAQASPPPAAAPRAQASPPAAAQPVTAPRQPTRWPVSFTADKISFEVLEPVADLWRDDQLVMHALVLARTGGQKQPEPGSVLMKATAEADGAAGIVALHGLQVVDARFQSASLTKAWTELLARGLPEKIETMQL